MKDYFKYNNGEGIVPDNAFGISASSISKFFDYTSNWYRENLIGEEGFKGNTASELGTVVHAGAAMYADDRKIDKQLLINYIDSIKNKEDVDTAVILDQYKPMIETLVNNYLIDNMPESNEEFLWEEILPDIVIRGTCDAYHAGIIRDYKTTQSKNPTVFLRNYWFQLMVYAWLYKQKGKPAHTLELVYVTRNDINRISEKTGKPMKNYPSRVITLQHSITKNDFALIEGCIKVIAESVQLWQNKPEFRYLLMQDYRYKIEAPKPIFP